MLSLQEQKIRLSKILDEFTNIHWQENKGERYRLTKQEVDKGSLWLRITKGNETIVVSTTGITTSALESRIINLIGVPKNIDGAHRDWFNVSFEHTKNILEYYSGQYLSNNSIEKDIENILSEDSKDITEKAQLISARIGQGLFRKSLINYWGKCAVTGVANPIMLLASHIKPWSKSNDHERLDPFNGLLLTPNIDRAFDQGLISFDSIGKIIISTLLEDKDNLGINSQMSISVTEQHQPYLEYHRNNVYKNT